MKNVFIFIAILFASVSCSPEMDEQVTEAKEKYYTIELRPEGKSDIYSSLQESSSSGAVYAVYYRGILVGGGTLGKAIKLNSSLYYDLFILSGCLGPDELPAREEDLEDIEIPISPDGVIPKSGQVIGMTASDMDIADGREDGRIALSLVRGFARAAVRVDIDPTIGEYYDEITVTGVRAVNGASSFCPFNPAARDLSKVRSGVWDSASSPSSGYYYLYLPENLQGMLLPDGTSAAGKSLEGLTAAGRDPSRCTYIEASLAFHSTAGTGLDVVYRFYPGGNNSNDFDIVRNRTYNVTLSLSYDGFNITGVWKSELESSYDSRRLFFSLPGGTLPSSWEIFDNTEVSAPLVIAMNFSRNGHDDNSEDLNLTSFPYGYRLYVDGQIWTVGQTLASGSSGLSYSVDASNGRISVYNGGSASAGHSMSLKIESIDGQLTDEINVLVRKFNTFGYGISGGADPEKMYLGQYSRLAITLGSNWKSSFSTSDINSLSLQIRNATGTAALNNKFYFKNTERLPESDLINVSVVSDAVCKGSLWIGNAAADIWKKVSSLECLSPHVVYSLAPGEFPVNLSDGDSCSDLWTYANSSADAEECVFYITYTDAEGRRLGGAGSFFDEDSYEGNLRADDFIDLSFPRAESPSIDISIGGPDREYDARVRVGFCPEDGSDWQLIHQLDDDPQLSFASVSMSNAAGSSLEIGLKVHPAVITLENSYAKTSSYTYPDSDWYLKAGIENPSGIPFSMDWNVYSRWRVIDYVRLTGSEMPYFDPPAYVYVDTWNTSREPYYASGIYRLELWGHALFSQSRTWDGDEMEYFNGSTTSNGFTGTLRQFMDREYLNSSRYFVEYSGYNPTNGQFVGTQRTKPTYVYCDYEVQINGAAAYDSFFRVVNNLMDAAWPIVYGSDFYDLRNIRAYTRNMEITVQ
ncbi:MAG: DUF4906 domain-containing protein [Bacteroidales bacterium]|nr:DUF4906 domain-containing protein [Bacteroidales bacterium]